MIPEPGQGTKPETYFARSICGKCIHQAECAEWGIHNERYGIWGGLTEAHRKQITSNPSYRELTLDEAYKYGKTFEHYQQVMH